MNKITLLIFLLLSLGANQVNAQCPEGMVETNNLVVNGDFSAGNRYFYSEYRATRNLGPEGTFQVGSYPTRYHSHFRGKGRAGRGDRFMIVNGSPKANTSVWCQKVKVKPKSHYNFSAWIATMVTSNPAKLHFSINGQVLGTNINAPYSLYNWKKFDAVWYSGEQTSATICIVNLSTIRGGNDFALDDIRFTTCIRPAASIQKKIKIQEAAAQTRH